MTHRDLVNAMCDDLEQPRPRWSNAKCAVCRELLDDHDLSDLRICAKRDDEQHALSLQRLTPEAERATLERSLVRAAEEAKVKAVKP